MNATILIVEDDPQFSGLVASSFYAQGFEVIAAKPGDDALRLAEQHHPIAIILDLHMSVMDGRAFYRRLRASKRRETREIPVLIISADGAEKVRSELGAQASLEKPFELDDLVLAVMVMLTPGAWRSRSLDLAPARLGALGAKFFQQVRDVGLLRPAALAAPFLAAERQYLAGFRRLLALRESEPGATEQLTTIIAAAEPHLGARLDQVAAEDPDRVFRSLREVIARRSYRRIHSAALSAGAVVMWSFPETDAGSVWRHGSVTGLLALLICEQDETLRDRAFAAGLLHDIGRLARDAARTTQTRHAEHVIDAAAAGAAVADALAFPDWLGASLHSCGLPADPNDELQSTVSAACAVARAVGFRSARDDIRVPPLVAARSRSRRVEMALEQAGGVDWIEERIRGPLAAARDGFAAALTVA